jgi:hypothetical protein
MVSSGSQVARGDRPRHDALVRGTAASVDRAWGDDYMVERWLAAYAVLALTSG